MKQVKDFYTTKRWREKRAAILKRDKYLCTNCKRYGRAKQATVVHHIKHLEDAPELAYKSNNLISLCSACHNAAHEEKGGWTNKARGNGYY